MSKIGAAQDALLILLQARPNLAGVPLDLGMPQGAPKIPEYIWISGDVEDWESEDLTTGVGPRTREERFVLLVRIMVQQSTGSYVTVRDRVLVLVGEVEATVQANHSISGSMLDATARGGQLVEWLMPGGRGVGATVRVACRADVT